MLDPFRIQPVEVGRAKIVAVNPLAKHVINDSQNRAGHGNGRPLAAAAGGQPPEARAQIAVLAVTGSWRGHS